MPTLLQNIEALRGHLGMAQSAFTGALGYTSRSTYTNWIKGQPIGDDTIEQIADHWQISLDSLKGKPGTNGLEPSPALRTAQESALVEFAASDCPGSPTERIVEIRKLLAEMVPGLSTEAWAEWLQWTMEDWRLAVEHEAPVGDAQIAGAAMLIGWYAGYEMWRTWIRTGQAVLLQQASERQIQQMAELLLRRYDQVQFRRLLNEPAR